MKTKLEREKQNLERFVLSEGYKEEELEHIQTKAQVENYNLMQKAVSRLILNSSGMTVITKALHSWKEFVFYRKRVKMLAQKVLGYRVKSDLMSSFNLWKNVAREEKINEDDLTKKELKNK